MSSKLNSLGEALYTLLIHHGGLSDRVYPLRIAQGSRYPAATYHLTDDEPENTKQSLSGIELAHVELNIYAEIYAQANLAAKEIRAVLDGYRGTAAGVVIDMALFEDEADQYDNAEQKYIKIQNYTIRIKN